MLQVQVLTAAPGGNSACTAGNPLDVTEMTNYVDKEHGSQDETRDGPPKKKRTADGISTQRSEVHLSFLLILGLPRLFSRFCLMLN